MPPPRIGVRSQLCVAAPTSPGPGGQRRCFCGFHASPLRRFSRTSTLPTARRGCPAPTPICRRPLDLARDERPGTRGGHATCHRSRRRRMANRWPRSRPRRAQPVGGGLTRVEDGADPGPRHCPYPPFPPALKPYRFTSICRRRRRTSRRHSPTRSRSSPAWPTRFAPQTSGSASSPCQGPISARRPRPDGSGPSNYRRVGRSALGPSHHFLRAPDVRTERRPVG